MPSSRLPTWPVQAQASRVRPAVARPVFHGCWQCGSGAEPTCDDTWGLKEGWAASAPPTAGREALEPGSRSLGWGADSLQTWPKPSLCHQQSFCIPETRFLGRELSEVKSTVDLSVVRALPWENWVNWGKCTASWASVSC